MANAEMLKDNGLRQKYVDLNSMPYRPLKTNCEFLKIDQRHHKFFNQLFDLTIIPMKHLTRDAQLFSAEKKNRNSFCQISFSTLRS